MPQAEPERVIGEIEDIIGIDAQDAVRCSAKSGMGIEDILEQIVVAIPPPLGDIDLPLQALIIDSWFDNYLGVVSLVRVVQGTLQVKDKIISKSIGKAHSVDSVGVFTPKRHPTGVLRAGEVGYMVAGIKDIKGAPVGDTLTHASSANVDSLPDFQTIKPQVYAGMFPVDSDDFEDFRDALGKLAAVSYTHLRAHET